MSCARGAHVQSLGYRYSQPPAYRRAVRRISRVSSALGIAALLLGATRALHSQQAAPLAPEEIGKRYIATLAAGNYAANASLMHTSALTSVRHLVVAIAARSPAGTLSQLVGVADTTALKTLPDTEIYARFLKATIGANATLAEAMRTSTAAFIGHIDEPPDLTHVLYRLTMSVGGMTMRKVDVITLQRSGDQWKALLSADLEAMVAQISKPGS